MVHILLVTHRVLLVRTVQSWLVPGPPRLSIMKIISEQQIRGVKIRMECRGTEDIQKESLYLEISDTGKVQASHDGNSDQTVMVLVPVGMAFYMHLKYSIIICLSYIVLPCYVIICTLKKKANLRTKKSCDNA